MKTDLPATLATLGHPQRLAVFQLLMRRYPDGVAAGNIARALDMKPSTLSAYLSALAHSGLITQSRVGTSLRYGVELEAVRTLLGDLFFDCCRGRPDLCEPLVENTLTLRALPTRKYGVLFVCTGNSARSIFAEALLSTFASDRFDVYSAGTQPRSRVDPLAVAVLQGNGHDTRDLAPKSIVDFQGADAPQLDFVFTVCDDAANEWCAPWPGHPVTAHWGVADPASATGSDAERQQAFRNAYAQLRGRIETFQALPFETLDKLSLQHALDDIAASQKETNK